MGNNQAHERDPDRDPEPEALMSDSTEEEEDPMQDAAPPPPAVQPMEGVDGGDEGPGRAPMPLAQFLRGDDGQAIRGMLLADARGELDEDRAAIAARLRQLLGPMAAVVERGGGWGEDPDEEAEPVLERSVLVKPFVCSAFGTDEAQRVPCAGEDVFACNKNVATYMLSFFDADALLKMGMTCSWMFVLCSQDRYWEPLFGRDKSSVSLVHSTCASRWKDRYRYAQCVEREDSDELLLGAYSIAEPEDIILLGPGTYQADHQWSYMRVTKVIAIEGHNCITPFAAAHRRRIAKARDELAPETAALDPELQQEREDEGKVILTTGGFNVLQWSACGGRIQNLFLRQRSPSKRTFCFALSVISGGGVSAIDCEFDSNSLTGVRIEGTFAASNCRMVHNRHAGVSVSPNSKVTLCGCEISDNELSGVEISSVEKADCDSEFAHIQAAAQEVSEVTLQDCHVHDNGSSGLYVGQGSVRLERNNIHGNAESGVEARRLAELHFAENTIHANKHHGIIVWLNASDEVEFDEDSLMVSNQIHNNRQGDVKIRRMTVDCDDYVKMALEDGVCTFLYTGKHFHRHDSWWSCVDCDLTSNEGCCSTCAKLCHAGHTLIDRGSSTGFYCDCAGHDYCYLNREAPAKEDLPGARQHRAQLTTSTPQASSPTPSGDDRSQLSTSRGATPTRIRLTSSAVPSDASSS